MRATLRIADRQNDFSAESQIGKTLSYESYQSGFFYPRKQKLGDSPRANAWRIACLLVSVADGLFDRKIERFEGLCPVVEAPFAPLSTSSTGGGAALASG